jgi:hypothetical protein
LFIKLKEKDSFNIAQVIQVGVIPLGYFYMMMETIYMTKMHTHFWKPEELNYERAWILFEIIFFFTWLQMSVIFVAFAYINKFKSIAKDERLLAGDNNVWNDKWSTDFLRYLKMEYFLVTYILTCITSYAVVGFSNFYGVDRFGDKDINSTGMILCILIFGKFSFLVGFVK